MPEQSARWRGWSWRMVRGGWLIANVEQRVPLAWAKARAMQRWIDHSGIRHRPMPTPYSGPQLGVGA
jgi:hypothetical protein